MIMDGEEQQRKTTKTLFTRHLRKATKMMKQNFDDCFEVFIKKKKKFFDKTQNSSQKVFKLM